MYELIQVAPRTYYIDCPTKIGIYRMTETDVCLIDTGNGKDTARKVLRHINENGWILRRILNTHSHADHIGGNLFLSERTDCEIYAPEGDLCFTRHPAHDPSLLYGGCPPKSLRNKFLMATPSDAKPLTPECLPEGMECLPLDGHCFAMAAFRTPDGVWFLGDSLISDEVMEKYHVSYLYDVGQYLASLETVKSLQAACFIPSHAPVTDNIAPLADRNIEKVHEVAELVAGLCAEPVCFETVLKGVFDHYGMNLNWGQYVLIGSTIRGYLAYLLDRQVLQAHFEDNRLLWQRT